MINYDPQPHETEDTGPRKQMEDIDGKVGKLLITISTVLP
jgi:hypothetical protein